MHSMYLASSVQGNLVLVAASGAVDIDTVAYGFQTSEAVGIDLMVKSCLGELKKGFNKALCPEQMFDKHLQGSGGICVPCGGRMFVNAERGV